MQRRFGYRSFVFAITPVFALALACSAAQCVDSAASGNVVPAASVQITHGPTMPPYPWEGVQITHGPTMPPYPWEG